MNENKTHGGARKSGRPKGSFVNTKKAEPTTPFRVTSEEKEIIEKARIDKLAMAEKCCPNCKGNSLFDIDDHYTVCNRCDFHFVS